MAQEIAKNAPEGSNPNDMGGMIKHVTESVLTMVNSGDLDINSMTNNLLSTMQEQQNLGPKNVEESNVEEPIISTQIKDSKVKYESKIKLPEKKEDDYEECDSDTDIDKFKPRTRDINININVDLKDLYTGIKKKIAIRRKRLKKESNGKMKSIEEKKKFIVDILPGMQDEQQIRFSKEADEIEGYETGDIVITINENANEKFERDGNNLFLIQNISLYESYAVPQGENIPMIIKHLDGKYLNCSTSKTALHENNGIRKLVGKGMPEYKSNNKGDLFIRFNLVLPEECNFYEDLCRIFPKLSDDIKETSGLDIDSFEKYILEDVSEEDLENIDYEGSEYSEDSYSDSE